MWLDISIALSCGGTGLACGWIIHAIVKSGTANAVRAMSETSDTTGWQETEPRDAQISQAADRLKSYAYAMAADVDAHQSKVQAVNHSLSEGNAGSPEAIFHAINQLVEANETMQSQLQSAQNQIHEQAMQIESAERRAETDALTRVPNRGAFDKHLERQSTLGAGNAGTLAVLDVDHFKKFNDVYGHRAGDEVLKVVAGIIHSRLQSYGIVARFGGEEFAVVIDGCPIEKARDLVESARAAIGARDIQFEDKRLRVTASAGIAEMISGETKESWLQRADDGLYASKAAGRDCSHWMDGIEPVKINQTPPSSIGIAENRRNVDPQRQSSSTAVMTDGVAKTDQSSANDLESAALANLPNHEMLNGAFDEIRSRTQSTVSMFIMAIRCHSKTSTTSMRALVQIVRATLRPVDRLGYEDSVTLLVCMPSVDDVTAEKRGMQICRAAAAIGLATTDSTNRAISVGVAQVGSGEDFDSVASRAIELAQRCQNQGDEAVVLETSEVLRS